VDFGRFNLIKAGYLNPPKISFTFSSHFGRSTEANTEYCGLKCARVGKARGITFVLCDVVARHVFPCLAAKSQVGSGAAATHGMCYLRPAAAINLSSFCCRDDAAAVESFSI
jgi:hypothetical protein